jgi:hypothetical protein
MMFLHVLNIEEDAKMPTCISFETIHNTWVQQFGKKGKDLFNAIVENLVITLEQ